MLKKLAKKLLPSNIYKKISLSRNGFETPKWGNMRRTSPFSSKFGLDRGTAIDRIYIERFLQENKKCLKGRVLEIGDREYSNRYGSTDITQSDVLHAVAGNDQATIIGDLASGEGLAENCFDCMILTQTLHVICDFRSAIKNAHHSLAPGGVLLATLPGISQISRYDMDRWGDYWRFTTLSATKVFCEYFGEQNNVQVNAHGNVLAATGLLYGLCAEEFTPEELDYYDPDYPVTITVKATKSRD